MQHDTLDSNTCTSTPTEQMNILLADAFAPSGVDTLASFGCNISHDSSLQGDALRIAIREHNPAVLIVRSTVVTEEMMDASEHLTVIIRAGAGYDTIDIQAASARGIYIANCPGKNAIAVAELTWGLILSCDRKIPSQCAELASGRWDKKKYSKANGLFGRTIGVVGIGGIGKEVIARAHAFGMNVVAWSRSLTTEKANELGVTCADNLLSLAAVSDVVSVHLASTSETDKIINADFFNEMKSGSIFVNTSRGKVVDEKALHEIAGRKSITVGLDVYENEPSSGEKVFTSTLAGAPFVFGTHHIGASTSQAQEAIADEVVRVVAAFTQEGRVLNCVNLNADSNAKALLCVRHKNLPGVLAHVFDELSLAHVNVEEMDNIMYSGNQAACARIQLDALPSASVIAAMKTNNNILSITVTSQNEEIQK